MIQVDAEKVTSVLLGNGWEDVMEGSFALDSLAYAQGGQEFGDRVLGFRAVLAGGGGTVAAPLASLAGVRYAAEPAG